MHQHAYHIPHIHHQILKKELNNMVELGILHTVESWMGIPSIYYP